MTNQSNSGQASGGRDKWTVTDIADETYESTAQVGDRHLTTNQSTEAAAGEALVVPVHEEELVATKRAREAGQVQITKDVVEEARTLEVPVTEERVQVTRRVVDRVGDTDAAAFREETIEVPLTTEEVELQKRVRVAEEVEIDREAVQTTQSVQGTVRREVVDVNETTAVETGTRSYTETDVSTGTTGQGIVGTTDNDNTRS